MEVSTDKMHEPVLLYETIEAFKAIAHLNNHKRTIVDATLGFAGHSVELIKNGFFVIGIETDEKVIELATSRLSDASKDLGGDQPYLVFHDNFINISRVLMKAQIEKVDGVLFDLGVNSYQLTSVDRGFSFANPDADLDMRLSQNTQGIKASDLLNSLRIDQLAEIFTNAFPEYISKKIARKVIQKRENKKFNKVSDVLDLVEDLRIRSEKINPATKLFMCLRIAVNSEIVNLDIALSEAFESLRDGGRLVIISFHSGEDKLVKAFISEKVRRGEGINIFKDVIVPSDEEIERNRRSRSAKMRILQRIK